MIFPLQNLIMHTITHSKVSLINPYPMLDAGHTMVTETQSSEQDRQETAAMCPGAQGLWESSEVTQLSPRAASSEVGGCEETFSGKMLTSAHTPFSASLSPPSPRPWSRYLCPLPHVHFLVWIFLPFSVCVYTLIFINISFLVDTCIFSANSCF